MKGATCDGLVVGTMNRFDFFCVCDIEKNDFYFISMKNIRIQFKKC